VSRLSAAIEWHGETFRLWRRRLVCHVAGHRDLFSMRHAEHCYRTAHADYPDIHGCRYCEEWVE